MSSPRCQFASWRRGTGRPGITRPPPYLRWAGRRRRYLPADEPRRASGNADELRKYSEKGQDRRFAAPGGRAASKTVLGNNLLALFVDQGESGALGRECEFQFGASYFVANIDVLILREFRFEDIEDRILKFNGIN